MPRSPLPDCHLMDADMQATNQELYLIAFVLVAIVAMLIFDWWRDRRQQRRDREFERAAAARRQHRMRLAGLTQISEQKRGQP